MAENNYEWLIASLDGFIRKYYANKVIRGGLVFLTCLLLYVLMMSVGEYYLYLPVWTRLSIVSLFVVLGGSALVAWVAIPLAKMARLGSTISHEQAAEIIGHHFPEVSDKLLNILQLKRQSNDSESRALAEASINQKIKQVSVVPMASAIDLSKNRKYLPYLLPVVLAGVFLLIAAPNVFKEGSSRLLQPTKAFERPAPFRFIIKNADLLAVRNTDFTLEVAVDGSALPADLAVEMNNERVPMQSAEGHTFRYTFRNVTEPINFRLFGGGFYSQPYLLKVVQRPVLKAFKVQISYPAYTGKKNEVRTSLSDMTLPVGTTVNWAFFTEHTDEASISFGNGQPMKLFSTQDMYASQFRFMNDTGYTISLKNHESPVVDSYHYQVQVIPDQYPVIQLQQFRDSISGKQIVLTGTVGDDYGIIRATFNYEVTDNNRPVSKKSIPVKIAPGALCAFQQYFDIESLKLAQGQKVSYYIEAWDNDDVHGSKSSRSEVMSYQAFNKDQLDSAINANSQQINSGLSNSAQQTKQLQNDYSDMQSKMMQSPDMDWQQQQSLQEMMKKQMELKQQMEAVKQRFDEQTQQSEQKKYSDDVREKQESLKKQMDNLMSEDLKEQMKKLQELMEKLNKEQAMQAMQQLEQENKLFNMDMQRMQEMMNRLDQQMRMEDLANKMDELAKKENELKNNTDANKKDAAQLSKDQKDLKDKLDKAMKEDLKDIEQLAKKTKEDKDLQDAKGKGDDAQKNMDQSQQNLQQQQKNKASKAQDDATKNLQEMARALRNGASQMGMEQIEKDIREVRQILSNLIRLSFDQEDLMASVRTTSTASQAYITNQEKQNTLRRNAAMIRDSMFTLSKHNDKLSAKINKLTTELEHNLQLATDGLEDRNLNVAITNQQYVMTKANDLALMLDEALSNMMQMQSQSQAGSGSCPMPGGKKPSSNPGDQLSDIITQQQQLGNAMQQAQQAHGNKPGQKPGEKPGDKPGGKQGDKPGSGGKEGKGQQPGGKGQGGGGANGSGQGQEGDYGDAEQLAKLAEQQAELRRKINDLATKLNSNGMNGPSRELRELEGKMDKTETDLVNRRLTDEMMQRQREIMSRLLETQKAVREQEQDDKRSSKTAQDISRPVPASLQKYLTDQKNLLELYKTVPPQLKPYYRSMVEEYFKMIGK